MFHSTQVAQQTVSSKSVARQLAASQALELLEGEVGKLCDCRDRKTREKKEKLEKKAAEENSSAEVEMEEAGDGTISEEMELELGVRKMEMEDEEEDVEMVGDEERAGREFRLSCSSIMCAHLTPSQLYLYEFASTRGACE